MKTAVIRSAAVEVVCPHCYEPQPAPDNGSHMWLPEQVETARAEALACTQCGLTFRLPKPRKPRDPCNDRPRHP